jgi:hypothetical protein
MAAKNVRITMSPEQPRQAPPVGRALRILLGVVLIVYVTPVYFRVPVDVVVGSLLLILGLIGVYSLIHIGVSRRIVPFGSCLAAGLLVAVYCCRCVPVADSWRRKRPASSSHVPRYFVGSRWRACRSRLRSDGDSRFALWEAHRIGLPHLFPPRQL